MRLITTFSALGQECVPWSVPDIGVSRRPGFATHRFAKKNPKLSNWQAFVKKQAVKAMERVGMVNGPVMIAMEFYRQTPPGFRHGQLWPVRVEWNDSKQKFTKRGKPSADLLNLFKAAEDACEDVIYANDAQTCSLAITRLYGPADGVVVRVWELQPEDFPGQGDVIPELADEHPPKVPRAVRPRTRRDPTPGGRGGEDGDSGRKDKVGVATPRKKRAPLRGELEAPRTCQL